MKNPVRESAIEARLVREVKAIGGLCFKFVSPGNAGVPDRIVISPKGRTYYVELKSAHGRLSPLQKYWQSEFAGRNIEIYVLNSMEAVRLFIEEVKAE